MDTTTAVVRARIAVRIFVKLFEAGDGERMPLVFDDFAGWPRSPPADHDLVADVVRSLRDQQVIHAPSADQLLEYTLLPTPRSRMANPMGAMKPLIDQIREDLARVNRGMDVPAGNWLDYEVRIRKRQLDREPL